MFELSVDGHPVTGDESKGAVLVHVAPSRATFIEHCGEFEELANSAGADNLYSFVAIRPKPEPKYYLGSGQVEAVAAAVAETCAGLAIFDADLSPSQERNLERRLQCRVLDRAGLILDIFAQRARSSEGKLQVELAQLQHLSTRLVRGWSHLERQKGGIGLRGPGETQLETDRRLLGHRVKNLKQRLARVTSSRTARRLRRLKHDVPTVSLVGYTNAGKSTLFNAVMRGTSRTPVYAADQLFATLDPTLRRWRIGAGEEVVLSDTVGFIRQLPHDLIAAFRATLEEASQAQLLLHVIDVADSAREERETEVDLVLHEIGAADIPILRVFNKIDQLDDCDARVDRGTDGQPRSVYLSAHSGAGLDLLAEVVAELLDKAPISGWIHTLPEEGQLRARVYQAGVVNNEVTDDLGGAWLSVAFSRRLHDELGRVAKRELEIFAAPETTQFRKNMAAMESAGESA